MCVGGTDFDTWWCRHFEVIRIGDRHYEARSTCFTPMRTPTILGRADGYPVVALGPMASVHVSALERFWLQCGRCTRSQPPAWGGKKCLAHGRAGRPLWSPTLSFVWFRFRGLSEYLKKILLSFVPRARHVQGDSCCSVSVRFETHDGFLGGLWRRCVAYCPHLRGSRIALYHPLYGLTVRDL